MSRLAPPGIGPRPPAPTRPPRRPARASSTADSWTPGASSTMSPATGRSSERMQRFTATLGERGLVVPLDAKALWGEARPPVAGTVNGHAFRSRLMVYGGETWLGLTNPVRARAGPAEGDGVDGGIDRDDAPREVVVPPELRAALDADDAARAAYERLSFTHRREYAEWIAEAKRAETRERRAARALERLRAS